MGDPTERCSIARYRQALGISSRAAIGNLALSGETPTARQEAFAYGENPLAGDGADMKLQQFFSVPATRRRPLGTHEPLSEHPWLRRP